MVAVSAIGDFRCVVLSKFGHGVNKLHSVIADRCSNILRARRFVGGCPARYTKWTDAAGVDRYGCEIIAEKVDFLSRPKDGEGEDPELVDHEDQFAG